MTGKEYLDEKYGTPRGNGYGIAGMLDDFAKQKVINALRRLPRHKVKIKANPSIDGLVDAEIETVEVDYLLHLLKIDKDFENERR